MLSGPVGHLPRCRAEQQADGGSTFVCSHSGHPLRGCVLSLGGGSCRDPRWRVCTRSVSGSHHERAQASSRCGRCGHGSARQLRCFGVDREGVPVSLPIPLHPLDSPQSMSSRRPPVSSRNREPVTVSAAPQNVARMMFLRLVWRSGPSAEPNVTNGHFRRAPGCRVALDARAQRCPQRRRGHR